MLENQQNGLTVCREAKQPERQLSLRALNTSCGLESTENVADINRNPVEMCHIGYKHVGQILGLEFAHN